MSAVKSVRVLFSDSLRLLSNHEVLETCAALEYLTLVEVQPLDSLTEAQALHSFFVDDNG